MPRRAPRISQIIVVCFWFALCILGVVYGLGNGSVFYSFLIVVIGLIGFISKLAKISEEIIAYNMAKTDYNLFVDKMCDRREKTLEKRREFENDLYERESDRLSHTPSCPICGSKSHVRRLGNLDRTVSTAVWGAASSAIGKQWECTSCNHKFNVDAAIPSQEPVKVKLKSSPSDPTEELRKYKKLLDDGVITQDDFDQKKKQLLGL